MQLHSLTLVQARRLLKEGRVSSVELTRAVIDRIDALDQKINAFINVDPDGALEAARRADEAIANGDQHDLTGIPLAIKDLICTRSMPTTCGSRILENFRPPYDATVIRRLADQKAVIVGKLNMDEFAMGSTTEHSAFGPTCNPWDLERIPGGSSGGAAAAVAADMCLAALGSDTGGSVRQPASHCGVVGLKPTYGRVSRFGLVAFASSLDQIGPMTKTTADAAVLLKAIAGHDPADSTSVPKPVADYPCRLEGDLKGLRIGLPREYYQTEGLDPRVEQVVKGAVAVLEDMGARTVEITLPHSRHAVAAYYVIAPSEASSNLARYDGVKYGMRDFEQTELLSMYNSTRSRGFGAEVQRRIILGTFALSAGYYDAYYGKASQVRSLIIDDFRQAFKLCDVIAAPVAPTPAYRLGETVDDPLTMYLSDVFTLSANLAGIPAISVPCGLADDRLPIGLQLMGTHFDEATLLKVGHQFEKAAGISAKPQL